MIQKMTMQIKRMKMIQIPGIKMQDLQIKSMQTQNIRAQKVGDDKKRGDYTSSRISTKNKQTFLYGRIEARMKLATGKGIWPAFWMLGTEGGWPVSCATVGSLLGFLVFNVYPARVFMGSVLYSKDS